MGKPALRIYLLGNIRLAAVSAHCVHAAPDRPGPRPNLLLVGARCVILCCFDHSGILGAVRGHNSSLNLLGTFGFLRSRSLIPLQPLTGLFPELLNAFAGLLRVFVQFLGRLLFYLLQPLLDAHSYRRRPGCTYRPHMRRNLSESLSV